LVQLKTTTPEGETKSSSHRDDLFEAAVDIVIREGRGSVSLLQRALGIGYGRAARLIDFMAEDGIVGPYNGSQARDVLITIAQWESMNGQSASAEPDESPKPRRSNKIRMTTAIDDEATEEDEASHEDDPPFDEDEADTDGKEVLDADDDADDEYESDDEDDADDDESETSDEADDAYDEDEEGDFPENGEESDDEIDARKSENVKKPQGLNKRWKAESA
jgi:DNA segregation ATPase FtsK/SpoIIIE, S-DNA-T family